MPSKASRSNGNGNGHCKVHPRTATACRACLVQGLQEFRRASVCAVSRVPDKVVEFQQHFSQVEFRPRFPPSGWMGERVGQAMIDHSRALRGLPDRGSGEIGESPLV